MSDPFAALRDVLSTEELIYPDSPSYVEESRTWSAQKDMKPRVVARPKELASLSHLVAFLEDSDLDFAVRCSGCGSASSKDVLISMSAFDHFEFDADNETILVGAGQVWGEVDRKMEQYAPGYAAISARCTYVGVGGSTIQGGVSWLSSEYGLTSDPKNMLDAQIVKSNGQTLWASEEPDLLWALRGGGGGFAVVVAFKLKVYKHPSSIYSGMILYPGEALPVLAKGISDFVSCCADPKVAMHFYCLDLAQGTFTGHGPVPGLAILIYDANGEEHGRSAAGFKWALEIPGATDMTQTLNYRQVNQQADSMKAGFGLTNNWMNAVTIPALDEQLILRTWKWFDDLIRLDPKLAAGSFVLIEVMQKPAFQSTSSETASAWPHPKNRHILQLGTGAIPGSPSSDALAVKALEDAPRQICPTSTPADCMPRDFAAFHDPTKMFGNNFEKLLKLKEAVDPKHKLQFFPHSTLQQPAVSN